MSVAYSGDVLRRCAIFHSQRTFGDHLTSATADNVTTENPIRLLVGQHFHKSVRVRVRLRSTVGDEWELADFISYPLK